MPLYLTFHLELLVRCLKDGRVNWTNTQWYDLEDLKIISRQQRRIIHIIEYKGDCFRQLDYKKSFFNNLNQTKWYYIPKLETDGTD